MKLLFIPAISKQKLNKSNLQKLKKLPKNLAIAYSIQYINIAKQIQKELSKSHNITKFTQVLGCSQPRFPKSTKAILLITDGKFHTTGLAIESNLPLYTYNNIGVNQITKLEIKDFQKKQKASYLKYLHSNNIGVFISTKPGQQNLNKALQFKKNNKKKSYLFIANNLNTSEFENFPQIQSWVNTACRRMDINDLRIINVDRII